MNRILIVLQICLLSFVCHGQNLKMAQPGLFAGAWLGARQLLNAISEGVQSTKQIEEQAQQRNNLFNLFKKEKSCQEIQKEKRERIQELRQKIVDENSIVRRKADDSIDALESELRELVSTRAGFRIDQEEHFNVISEELYLMPWNLAEPVTELNFEKPKNWMSPANTASSGDCNYCLLVTQEEVEQWIPVENPVAGRAYKTVSRVGGPNSMHCGVYIGEDDNGEQLWIHINHQKVSKTVGINSFASPGCAIYEHPSNHLTSFSPDLVIRRAKKALELQQKKAYVWRYLPATSNCEHLTMLIMTGEFRSLQVDAWKKQQEGLKARFFMGMAGNTLWAFASAPWAIIHSGCLFDASVADSLPVGPSDTSPPLPRHPSQSLNLEDPQPVYRWYDLPSGNHFYCLDSGGEFAPRLNYRSEGIAFRTLTREAVATVPLYRACRNGIKGSHHFYTTDSREFATVTSILGFSGEGHIGYVFTTHREGTLPLHRYYHKKIDKHFYTIHPEREKLETWKFESVIGYVYPEIAPDVFSHVMD